MQRAIVLVALLAVSACAGSPLANMQESRAAYRDCLNNRPAAQCENQRLQFEADMRILDQRQSGQPLVLSTYRLPTGQAPAYRPPQPINCTTYGPNTTCY